MARLSCLINLNIYRGYKYRKPLESIFMRNLNLFIMKCISIYFVTLLLLMSGCESGRRILLKDLRCENLENPVAIDNTHPHFSWKIETDGQTMRQAYFEIQVATDSSLLAQGKADLWNSGKVESSASVMVPYRGKELRSSVLAYWKVRVWDDKGESSDWSPINRFGIGLLDKAEWQGKYIGMPDEKNPMLRKKFELQDRDATLLLHVNSLGYHEIYLNGKKVSEDVLSPAVSQLNKRSLSVTYDLTSYAKQGTNDLWVWLGRGWYRKATFNAVHDGPLVKLQLDEIQRNGTTSTLLVTDSSWEGRGSMYGETGTGTWYPHQFGGECVDGRKALPDLTTATLDELDWKPVLEVEVPGIEVSPQMCEPNRIQEIIRPKGIKQIGDSIWLVDMGKALNGWVELSFPKLPEGHRVRMEYTDWLNENEDFKPQEENGQYEDWYIGSGQGKEVFRNKFNHHAFQYIRISGLAKAPEEVTGYLIHTDYKDASSFECSDPDLNAIYAMIKYTFKNLAFSGYIVDCPHYERMGYGGDGNASCKSFQTLYEGSSVYMNWMQMWQDCIREDGGMPHCVPNPYPAGGGPYWCGFIITGSWQTYLNYGDSRLIERYYPVMRHWLRYVDAYTVDGLLKRWPDTDYRAWYLGDWLAPAGVDYTAQSSVDLVSNCFISDCLTTMEKIAKVLGKAEDAAKYKERRQRLNELIQKTFYDPEKKQYATGSQIDRIYPMLVGVTDEQHMPEVKEGLYRETLVNCKGHIGSGLVGVTILTDWAIKNGEADFLYSMLKKREQPGYLYMIDQGASTTWEYWSGERSKVHNCFNGIGAWFCQAIGGILPDEDRPGYKHFFIKPQVPDGVTWARVARETPYGTARVSWTMENRSLSLDLEIPANSTATFIAPFNVSNCVLDGNNVEISAGSILLESGKHTLSLPAE